MKIFNQTALVVACSIAFAASGGAALAADERNSGEKMERDTTTVEQRDLQERPVARTTRGAGERQVAAELEDDADDVREDQMEAHELLDNAHETLARMRSEPELQQVLQQSEGVFVVPHYGRAALVVGARGGEGVLMTNENGELGNPAFYDFGGVSAGLQAGIEAGAVAMILNTQEALDSFRQENNWSLNADAGLTVVTWSAKGQASAGMGDVIVWSDAKGLMGDLAISVTDINFDEEETGAFYGESVTLDDVLDGRVQAPRRAVAETMDE